MQSAPPILLRPPRRSRRPELIGCLLVKRQPSADFLWGVLVDTEAYSHEERVCHGYRHSTSGRRPNRANVAAAR